MPLSSGKGRGFSDQRRLRTHAGVERKLLHRLQGNHLRAADNALVQPLRQLDERGFRRQSDHVKYHVGPFHHRRAKGQGFAFRAARHRERGLALAKQYGFQWQPRPEGIAADILVNVTPLGMAGGNESESLAFSEAMIERASVVFDVVALPPDTPVIKLAQRLGKKTISGAEVIALQAVEQFVMYTGMRPDAALVAEAAKFAREG